MHATLTLYTIKVPIYLINTYQLTYHYVFLIIIFFGSFLQTWNFYRSLHTVTERGINLIPIGKALGIPETTFIVIFFVLTIFAIYFSFIFGSTALIGLISYFGVSAAQEFAYGSDAFGGGLALSANSGVDFR